MQDKDQQFVDAIKSELKESVDNINARDLSAITQARYQALECQQTSAKKAKKNFSWMFFPAGAIATVCLAVVVYNFIPVTPVSTDGQSLAKENQTRENRALVSTLEGFDFNEDPEISEELDFLEWLDAYESSS
ncbi:MAG: hypothetical protein E2O62_01910 [Gammaproteobacteria bacterium]|nr:MAG: hypothetical protein E2O62_01910 [Gammaproteobacteria bacterium]